MKRLVKGPVPEVLLGKGAEWTEAYVAARATGDEKSHERWRHHEIRESLLSETRGFCAYCEAQMLDVTYPHVEHIAPKSVRPELAHEWTNLTWACPRCNVHKDDFYESPGGVLNPYIDQIDQHLEFHGDFVDCPLGDRRGELTITACDLNRLDLVHSRVRRLAAVRALAERWHGETGALKAALGHAIRIDVANGEFSATVTAYLRRIGVPLTEG